MFPNKHTCIINYQARDRKRKKMFAIALKDKATHTLNLSLWDSRKKILLTVK